MDLKKEQEKLEALHRRFQDIVNGHPGVPRCSMDAGVELVNKVLEVMQWTSKIDSGVVPLASVPASNGRSPLDDPDWIPVADIMEYFYRIRMIFPKVLTEDQIDQVSGCLGYALREVIRGEDLSDPVTQWTMKRTFLTYDYDSTKSRSDDPDFAQAFAKARAYIEHGTPIRSTNRSGPGTEGTALVEGIGPVSVQFFVS